MLLRLPILLRRAVLGCMPAFLAISYSDAAVSNGESIVFCGDSITQGAGTGIGPGYRYQVFKNFVDNSIAYKPLGTQETAGGATNPYRGVTFDRHNEGHSAWWASDLNGTTGSTTPTANHASIENWTGQSNTQYGGQPYTGPTYVPDTVFIMAGTNDILHKNNTTAPPTQVIVDRILKCADQYKAANPNAHVYISGILPMEAAGMGGWTPAEYNKRTREVNEALKKIADEKGFVFVQTDQGMRGASDSPLSSFTGDGIHPNAQGELIMAGNIARSLGIGQRNAGMTRTAAAGLAQHLSMSSVPSTGMNGKAWSLGKEANTFTINSNGNSYYEQSWSGSNLAQGYTCELSLQMFAKAGSNQFSLQLGNGTTTGTLNVEQGRVAWGTTVLYVGLNTNTVSEYRVAYNIGDASKGIGAGYYVWRNGVLIGEALAGASGSFNGVKAGSLAGGSLSAGLSGLGWDTTGAYAPDYTGIPGADAQGTERLNGFASMSASGWKVDWPAGAPTEISAATVDGVRTAVNALTGTPKNAKITSTIVSPSGGALLSANGDAYLDFSGTWVNTQMDAGKYLNLIAGNTYNGNLYFKISEGGKFTTGTAATPGTVYQGALLGINACAYTGNLYLEFDSSVLTIEGRTLVQSGAVQASASVVGIWGPQNLTGSVTMVFNKGTFGYTGNTGDQGAIIAGAFTGGPAAGAVTKSTFIEINGGTFYGAISSGGYEGDVAIDAAGGNSANMRITGGTISGNIYGGSLGRGNVGTSTVSSGTNILIDGSNISASHALSISGNVYGGSRNSGIVYGDANITLSNFDQVKLSAFDAKMSFNGGSPTGVNGTVKGSKILTLDKVTGDIANALNNFDRIVVSKDTNVGLTYADNAKSLKNVRFSGAGSLALKAAGTYQFGLAHTGAVGDIDASGSGVISNIILGKTNEGSVVSMNALKLSTGSLTFDIGKEGSAGSFDTLAVSTMTSTGKIDIAINAWQTFLNPGTYDLITGDLKGVHDFILLTPSISSRQQWNLLREDGKLKLAVTGDASKNLTWNGGAAGTWQNGTGTPWNDGTGSSTFEAGDMVTFTTLAGVTDSIVTLQEKLLPTSIVVSGDTNYTWRGDGSISGKGTLEKSGNGSLVILTNNSDYSGSVVLKGGVLEMGHANALGTGSLAFNGGTLKYGTGVTSDVSSRIAAATDGNDNKIRVDTNGNKVAWANARSDYDYIKSGAGTLSLKASGAVTYAKSMTVNGGVLGFDSSSGNIVLSGTLTGTGGMEKTGSNNLFITGNSNDLKGNLNVKGGLVVLGASSTEGGGALAKLGSSSTITIENGASFRTHLGGSTVQTFEFGQIYVKSGGSLGNIDGSAKWTGNIAFNVDTIGADGSVTYNTSGTSTLYQFYSKRVVLDGIVSGGGTVKWETGNSDGGTTTHIFALANTGNTFSGTYLLDTAYISQIELASADTASGGVASKASIVLKSSNSSLLLSGGAAGSTISLVNLDTASGTKVYSSNGAKNLILNDTKDNLIAGALGDATNAINLEKKGAKTLTISGTIAGSVKATQGTLQLGNTATYTTTAGITIGGSSALDVGGVNIASTLTLSNLKLEAGSRLIMDVGPGTASDKLVYTGTQALSGAHVLDIMVSGVTATGEYVLIDSTTAFDASFSAGTWVPTARGMQGSFVQTANQLKLNITAAGVAGNLVWAGTSSSNIWELKGATNWSGEADNKFYSSDNVQFTDAAVNKTVVIKGSVAPGSIVVNSSSDYVFASDPSGGGLTGTGALTKEGTGRLTINSNNQKWASAIALNAGILEFGENGQGKATVTMANGTILQWGANNNQTISSIVANGANVELNTGANTIGSQAVTGTYTTLKKTGTGSITLALSGAGKTLNVDKGTVTLASGADISTSFIIGQGATLKLTTNTETGNNNGSLTLNGGTLDFGSVGNNYIGGSSIVFNAKSLVKGIASSLWRLEGDRPTTISVAAAASGSTISVETINFTRSTNPVVFNIEDGAESFDLSVSSNLQITMGGEKLKKTGKGTLLLTGTSASGNLGMLLEDGVIQIGNAANGNSNGVWDGTIDIGTSGRLVIDKTNSLDLCKGSALLSGSGVIDIINTGKVNLTNSAHTYKGTINIKNGGTLNLSGGAMQAETNIVINKGGLEQASAFAGSVSISQTDASSVDVGGLNGAHLKSVIGAVAKDATDNVTKITGVSGNISLSGGTSFGISSDMVGVGTNAATGEAITFTDSGSLTITGDLSLSFTDRAVQSLLEGQKGDKDVSLKLVDGMLTITGGSLSFNTPYNILSNIFTYNGTNGAGGSVLLSMKDPTKQGWIVVNQTETTEINDKSMIILPGATGIHNNGTININVTGEKTLVLNNLEGSRSDNGAVITTGTNTSLTLSLVNTGGVTSSLYHGSITGSAAIEKNGLAGTTYDLTIGGNVKTSKLTVNNGTLTVGGVLESTQVTTVNGSSALVLNGVGSQMDGGLVLSNTGTLKLGAGATASTTKITSGAGSIIELASGANLSLTESGSLDSTITGNGGTLSLKGNGTTLTVGANGDIGRGTVLSLADQTKAEMTGNKNAAGIAGQGILKIDGNLVLHDGSQTFEGTLEGNGTLDHAGVGKQTLNTAGNANMNLVQSGTGILEINYKGTSVWKSIKADQGTIQITDSVTTSDLIVSGNVHIILGSDLQNGIYNTSAHLDSTTTTLMGGSQITLGGVTAGSVNNVALSTGTVTHSGTGNTRFELGTVGNWSDSEYRISLMSGQQIDTNDYEALIKGSLRNLGYTVQGFVYEDSILKVIVQSSGTNGFLRFANSANTASAAEGLWQSLMSKPDDNGTLSAIIGAIRDAESGVEGTLTAQEATQALASYAGSSLTSLSSSQRSGLVQQVKWIRNRTAQMGVNSDFVNEDMPYVNAWVQGNAGYHKVSKDGDQAGYTMNSWGGTAGVDIDLSEHWTVGAAFTADYAKIRTEAYDTARGNNDAYYGNLFARLQKRSWSHTLILTGGWNDVDLNRNVNIGSTQFNTKGTTSGASYGAYYEGTYDVVLNDRKTSIFQPLFNASIYQSSLDAYSESGMGDASMSVREMKATYGTVGLGARLTGIVGNNILGRGCLGEVRAQVVQDYGDKSDTVNISPLGSPSSIMKIRGSKVGTTGIQIGAGLAIPVAERSSIYVDADADFRSKATVVTGNIGYRYNF